MHNSNPIAAVQNASVHYKTCVNPHLTMKERVLSGFRKQFRYTTKEALRDVSITISQGESIAILGPNGAGKSTLLKVMAGVLEPYQGTIQLPQRLGALIELEAGFEPELTGFENLFFAGTMMGLSTRLIRTLIPSILNFSELTEVIHQPYGTYSSGMKARLGFSLAACSRPDLLIVDEVLAVGDSAFQEKCIQFACSYVDSGGSLLLVTHDRHLAKRVCTRALWMENGTLTQELWSQHHESDASPDSFELDPQERELT